MSAIASQITSLAIVYATVYSGGDQGKHQRSVSLAFVRGIHRSPVNSPHKGPIKRKMFPLDYVIMIVTFIFLSFPGTTSQWRVARSSNAQGNKIPRTSQCVEAWKVTLDNMWYRWIHISDSISISFIGFPRTSTIFLYLLIIPKHPITNWGLYELDDISRTVP